MCLHHRRCSSTIAPRTSKASLASVAMIWRAITPQHQPPISDVREGQPLSKVPLPDQPLSVEGTWLMGQSTAAVAMLVFADFECPYCAQFARDRFPEIKKRWVDTGLLRVGFRHFPLRTKHHAAQRAAEAAECAGLAGRFWQMHDLLFADVKNLGEDAVHARANDLGLPMGQFRECMNGKTRAKVDGDVTFATEVGVSATPTFLLGTITDEGRLTVRERLLGAQPVGVFDAAVGKLVKAVASETR
jgi:protein-disulfide isomerase